MNPVSDYSALARVDGANQLKALVQAVSFDLALPNHYIDLHGGQVGAGKSLDLKSLSAGVKAVPDAERIKAFMARKYATPSDTPVLSDVAPRVETFFHTNMPEIDLGWTNFFKVHDLRGSNQDSFEIIDTDAGVVFKQRAPGEVVEIRRQISEAETTVKAIEFAAGVGILDRWLRYQKWWKVSEVVGEFIANAWDKMAEWHYGLFTAMSTAIDVAFDTDDTVTLNKAAAGIFRAVRNKGYAVGTNAGLWILTSPEQKGRVLKMLEATQGSLIVAYAANKQPITATIAGVVSSTYVTAGDTGYYLILPNRKIQRGQWRDLTIEDNHDIYKGADDLVGRMEFNAAIGDSAQVRRVKFS